MHDQLRMGRCKTIARAKSKRMLFTQMHLKTLPMRFPDGGIFLYKLPPATNITKRKEIEQNF